MEEEKEEREVKQDEEKQEEEEVQEAGADRNLPSTSSAGSAGRGRSWWQTDQAQDQSDGSAVRSHAHTHRRLCLALFPDLGSTEGLSRALQPPDPSLLPAGLVVGSCDVAPWRRRINLREVKMSYKERRREEDRSRRRWDINRDRQVDRQGRLQVRVVLCRFLTSVCCGVKVLQCRNWTEYHQLLSRRERRSRGRREHLWNHEVTPLHDPRQPISTGEAAESKSRLPLVFSQNNFFL